MAEEKFGGEFEGGAPPTDSGVVGVGPLEGGDDINALADATYPPDEQVELTGGRLVVAQGIAGDAYGVEPVLLAPSTSSGLACHGSLEEASLSGLFELVERDAFMLVWSNRLSLPRLTW